MNPIRHAIVILLMGPIIVFLLIAAFLSALTAFFSSSAMTLDHYATIINPDNEHLD